MDQHLQLEPKSQQPHFMKTGPWSPAEDWKLQRAVAKHGTQWLLVGAELRTGNIDRCEKQWSELNKKLNPSPELNHKPWTSDEEASLRENAGLYHQNWEFVSKNIFEGRTPVALKNRYTLLMRRLNRQRTRRQQPSEIESQMPAMIIDQGSYFGAGNIPHSSIPDYAPSTAAAAPPVKYSVTCQRGKLKKLVNQLMDIAMSESAGTTVEDDQVTVTLEFKA